MDSRLLVSVLRCFSGGDVFGGVRLSRKQQLLAQPTAFQILFDRRCCRLKVSKIEGLKFRRGHRVAQSMVFS